MVSSLLSTVRLQSAEGISLRTARFLISCAPSASAGSVHLLDLEIKTVFNVRFHGQAGPPQVHVSKPLQGWIGSLAGAPFGNFGSSLGYRFGYR